MGGSLTWRWLQFLPRAGVTIGTMPRGQRSEMRETVAMSMSSSSSSSSPALADFLPPKSVWTRSRPWS